MRPTILFITTFHPSDILRRIIVEQVAALMVLPNKLPISLSDVVPAQILRTPEPEVSGNKNLMILTAFENYLHPKSMYNGLLNN